MSNCDRCDRPVDDSELTELEGRDLCIVCLDVVERGK